MLTPALFEAVLATTRDRAATCERTGDNTQRALMLARYAESITSLGYAGEIRQRASLGTFCLPDCSEDDPIWRVYFAGTPGQTEMFRALRRERNSLAVHARTRKCRLILDPVERLESVFRDHGIASVRARVDGLLAFLRDKRFRTWRWR